MATFLTANSFLGLGIEGSRGVASSSMKWIPITSPQVTPMQTFLRDEALRGSAVSVYDHIAGVRHDEYDAKGYLFPDTFPVLLRGILGGTDTITGSSAPYTHTIPLLNNNATGSQPPSLTIQDFDGANAFQILGAQMSNLDLTFGAEAAVEWASKFTGNGYTVLGSAPSASYSPANPFVPGWDVSVSIGGSALTYIAEGSLKIERSAAPIFTMGTQTPRVNFAGPISVTGSITAIVDSTSDLFTTGGSAYGLYRNAQPMVLTLTDPVTNYATALTMTKVQFTDPKRTRGKAYVQVEVSFEAQANTTDSGGTGYAPIKSVTTNSISTAF
jgi:Phage tail tube protein